MNMVERVAKAMWEAEGGTWPPEDSGWRSGLMTSARAVIEAMREPTQEMMDGLSATGHMWRDMNSVFVWQTFIDAALTCAESTEPKS